MTWRCPLCKHPNEPWRNKCVLCLRAVYGWRKK